jgi:hypothetical protein
MFSENDQVVDIDYAIVSRCRADKRSNLKSKDNERLYIPLKNGKIVCMEKN